jgi:MFS family permease
MQDLVPNEMRGFSVALFGAIGGLLAVSIGPLLVALATEHLFGRPELIGYSLAIVGIPALVGSALCYAAARRALQRELGADGELARVVNASRS